MSCPATTQRGTPCQAPVLDGRTYCKWHDPDPVVRARVHAESVKGGKVGLHPSTAPIASVLDVDQLDLAAPAGWLLLLSAAARLLCRLPLDTKTANALAVVAAGARSTIESDFAARLDALESAVHTSARTTTGPRPRPGVTPAMRSPAVWPASRR